MGTAAKNCVWRGIGFAAEHTKTQSFDTQLICNRLSDTFVIIESIALSVRASVVRTVVLVKRTSKKQIDPTQSRHRAVIGVIGVIAIRTN